MLPRRVLQPRYYLLLALAAPAAAPAQSRIPATIREYSAELVTYPFSDPNPVPVVGRIYPYFRFDGFTDVPVRKMWKVIDLENRWIRVSILPEIGGKIWRAIDKATGKSFIYDNHVVKFRDIAMRGPWTSGGIEANYGIIGHTPNVATPVDYITMRNTDGSVTCTIGVLDLLTRTNWRLAISLPADKAYFTTASFWHNGTPFEQPYYSWMNAAIPVGEDLEFIYPGNHFIGHAGEVGDWPVNNANGKSISFYRDNDFGGYKSYHVFGQYTDFFGAYWHKQDFGMVRYAPHDEKPGKKLWIWGLSRQGMIWEQLLTDTDGQYTEVQSGRLFNQTAEASSQTPFKHRGFAPYSSDRWTEYWFPVRGTDGFVTANPWGALNVQANGGRLVLSLSPVQSIADSIEVFDGQRRVYARMLRLAPLQRWRDSVPAVSNPSQLRVTVGHNKIEWAADTSATVLARPVTSSPFDWNTAYGQYLAAKEKIRERDYIGAERQLVNSIVKDSTYLPALVDLASLRLRRGDGAGALRAAYRALGIDTYDPAANFIWGEANVRAGRRVDARDGFDIASQSPEWRSAAYTALAKLYLGDGDQARAIDYATKALDYNRFDVDAWQVTAVANRIRGNGAGAAKAVAALLSLDPLSHFARIERWFLAKTPATQADAMRWIRNEMPAETLLEIGIWYAGVGQLVAADMVLGLAPPHPEVLYYRAFLHDRLHVNDVAKLLASADSLSPRLVFPSRTESATILEWAATKTTSWHPRYFLGLIHWSLGDSTNALAQFNGIGNAPTFAPFYAARAELEKGTARGQAMADLLHAAQIDPAEWRYGKALAEWALTDGRIGDAVALVAPYFKRSPRNPYISMLYARALLRNNQASEARRLLDSMVVLPYEGAGEAHALYREANLLGALVRIQTGDSTAALQLIAHAREWPERLGSGKPYPADVDERLEDLLVLRVRASGNQQLDIAMQAERLAAETRDPVVERVVRAWGRQ